MLSLILQQVFPLLFLVVDLSCGSDYPCANGWNYSKLSGKCYLFLPGVQTYSTSLVTCQNNLSVFAGSKGKVGLAAIRTVNDLTGMTDELIKLGNNAPFWIDCVYNGSMFLWSDKSTVNSTLLSSLASSSNLTGPCLMLTYFFINSGSGFTIGYIITSAQCNESASFFCQHDATICQDSLIPLYSSTAEVLVPPLTTVGSMPFVACITGSFRMSQLLPPASTNPGPIPLNYVNCTGMQAPDSNPFMYLATWVLNSSQSVIEACLPVACSKFNGTLINVQSQVVIPPTSVSTSYSFGTSYPVTCIPGFVNYADPTTNTASVTCAQSTISLQLGVWNPQSNAPCVPLMCNLTQLINMIPGNSAMTAARNRATKRVYNVNLQMSSLPYYDNIITIQCNDGFFFSDRTYQKSIICGMQNNSLVIGQWQGYLGSIVPLDSSCQIVTCTSESVTIKASMNLQSTFYVMDANGVYQNLSEPSVNPYPYQTNMRFLCIDGYSSVNQATDQNLTCGPQGVWVPNLTPCIQISPALKLGNQLHYVPPAVEAQSAQQVGYIVIVILVVFLSLIVILDISTFNRDIKTLRTNLKNIKRFTNRNKT